MSVIRTALLCLAAFTATSAIGYAIVPAAAECRQCNVKKCYWDSDCGRLCACIFPGGKGPRKGFCAQVEED